MSAFVPSEKHFQYMANHLVKQGHYHSSKVESIIQTLVNECFRSVNYRYKTKDKPFKFVYTEKPLQGTNAAQFIMLCRCTNYQACETPNYEKTKAYRMLKHLIFITCGDVESIREKEWTF